LSELSDRALDAIKASVETKILTDKAGNEYTTRQVVLLEKDEKQPSSPACFNVHTLTGLIDFIARYKEKNGVEDPSLIQIANHAEVYLFSEPFGPEKKRTVFVKAAFESLLGTSFKFGTYYNQEDFIVGLQALFEPTPSRADVLKVVGTIADKQIAEHSDDGVTQHVNATAGLIMVKEIAVPNPVFLKPFRTFREVDQPESPFVLRVRSGKDKPECALFEADGGRWKLAAIQSIKEYLEDKTELPIIA
jgi:hypothetical protein